MPKNRSSKQVADDWRGDSIKVGNITGSSGVAIGRGAQATTTQKAGVSAERIAEAFAAITAKVEALPEGSDKTIASSAVKALLNEAHKGDKASERKVTKWLRCLAQTAPEAFEVAIASFANPIAGLGLAFKKIAERAKEETHPKK